MPPSGRLLERRSRIYDWAAAHLVSTYDQLASPADESQTRGLMAKTTAMNSFKQSIKSLLDTGDYSDFKITCNGEEWNVHKAIICPQSDFFKGAAHFGGQETINKAVDLPEDDPVAVGCMIRFMYDATYDLPSDSAMKPWWVRADWKSWPCNAEGKPGSMLVSSRREGDLACWTLSTTFIATSLKNKMNATKANTFQLSGEHSEEKWYMWNMYVEFLDWKEKVDDFPLPPNHRDAFIHAHVYSLADKYAISALKTVAAAKFKQSIDAMFSGTDFFDAVSVAFTTTPDTDDTLRSIAAEKICKEKKIYGMYDELRESMKTIPGLAYHVWKHEWSMEEESEERPAKRARVDQPLRSSRSFRDLFRLS